MLQQISGESAVGAACGGIFFESYVIYKYSCPYVSVIFYECKKIALALIVYKVLESRVVYSAFS